MEVTDQQREIILTVVSRFINLGESTSRKQLIRQFKDIKAIDELLKGPFFSCPQTKEYLPLPMAFQYCGEADFLTQARQATGFALHVLQKLDEAYPEKDKDGFTREEFITHAGRIHDGQVDQGLLMLGLHLSTHFGIFTHWSSSTVPHHTPTSFGFHESIVTVDPSLAWDEYIQAHDVARGHTESLSLQPSSPEEVDLRSLFSSRPAAVRPTGRYDYHPEIKRVSEQLCLQGNFRQAALEAFIHVIASVKERTALRNKQGLLFDGDDLMNRAFCPDNQVPPVRFNAFVTDADRDEQRGIWNLFKGIVGLRNFKAHVVTTLDDPHRAHENTLRWRVCLCACSIWRLTMPLHRQRSLPLSLQVSQVNRSGSLSLL